MKTNRTGNVHVVWIVVFVLVLSLLLGGCEDEVEGGLSCQFKAVCDQFNGELWVPDAAEVMCARLDLDADDLWAEGTLTDEDCPDVNTVGTCAFDPGGRLEMVSYYYPNFDAESARADCELRSGIWEG